MRERYRLLRQIGGGGYGCVYLAYDEKLAVYRVVKEARLDQCEHREWLTQRFISEIHILKEIHHPFVPQITDVITMNSMPEIVMEYVEGINLQKYIEEKGSVALTTAIDWGIQLTQIFRYLHGRKPSIIHQDVKPSNIILHPSGRLYLIDFGNARFCTDPVQLGDHCGTQGYAAPELYEKYATADERSDIYSLGKTLCFCIFGAPQLPSDVTRTAYGGLGGILKKCTCLMPEERFQNVEELERALRRISDGPIFMKQIRDAVIPRRIAFISIAVLIIGMSLSCLFRQYNMRLAMSALEHAQEVTEEDKILSYYRIALRKAPWLESIYQSIVDKCVMPGSFSTEKAVKLINMLGETNALSVLKRQNPSEYADFCYSLGIGYFYYIGGNPGKQESEIWFSRAEKIGKDYFPAGQWDRARCYRMIAGYYKTFLSYGYDQSGEKNSGGYDDFFDTLEKLWESSEKQMHNTAGQKAFLLISQEIAIEIREEAEGFLQDSDVSSDMLLDLLNQICKSVEKHDDDISSEDEKNIFLIIADAKKTIQILEENCEKNK